MNRILCCCLLSLLAGPCFAQSGLSVAPARLFFHSTENGPTRQIVLTNTVDRPVRWLLSVQDWDRDSLGRKRFFEAGTVPASCAAQLQIVPNEVEVPANGQATVSVTLKADKTHTGSQHAMIMVNEAPDITQGQKGIKKASIEVRAAFAIHVYVVQDAAPKGLEIQAFKYARQPDSALLLSLQNTGGQPLDATINVTITDKNSNREWKIPPVSSATLPGAYRTSHFQLPADLPAGKYLAIGTVDCGDDLPLKVAELSFDLP